MVAGHLAHASDGVFVHVVRLKWVVPFVCCCRQFYAGHGFHASMQLLDLGGAMFAPAKPLRGGVASPVSPESTLHVVATVADRAHDDQV
ncbi:hypothetical protein ASE87_10010 [Frigoribacterium sp. Leaf44]|nr:hypothetical protein ASE87_10010 [Frigoribacterium sp. Leaf44]